MHLFTWNIGKRVQMASRALAYLERLAVSDFVVASLQEWPWKFPNLQGHSLDVVRSGGAALIVYSRELTLIEEGADASGRATVARFRLPSGSELTVVSVHWHARDSRSEVVDAYERGGAMALFRHHLERQISTPAVILGDFNSSPHDHERELCSKYCLFALDRRHRTTKSMERVMGQDKKAWVLIEPVKPADAGTYFWSHTQAWSDLDHIILTPDIASRVQSAEVLARLEGHEFLTSDKRVPRGETLASDHLPVICKLHFQ